MKGMSPRSSVWPGTPSVFSGSAEGSEVGGAGEDWTASWVMVGAGLED